MNNGIEGPRGPPGPSFSFDLCTSVGSTGPIVTGPLRVEPGNTVQLWINSENQLMADVI